MNNEELKKFILENYEFIISGVIKKLISIKLNNAKKVDGKNFEELLKLLKE